MEPLSGTRALTVHDLRVGKFDESINKPRHVSPTIIHDEGGNELYR